jgi:hypothetical protein
MTAVEAMRLVAEDLALEDDPARNLATFVTTWMEPELDPRRINLFGGHLNCQESVSRTPQPIARSDVGPGRRTVRNFIRLHPSQPGAARRVESEATVPAVVSPVPAVVSPVFSPV